MCNWRLPTLSLGPGVVNACLGGGGGESRARGHIRAAGELAYCGDQHFGRQRG